MGEYVEKFLTMGEGEQREVLREMGVGEEGSGEFVKDLVEGVRGRII